MKLWLVTQWGSPYDKVHSGANGPDTNCFVSAETFERAVELGEACLKTINGDWRNNQLDQVMLLGENDNKEEKAHWSFVMHAFPFVNSVWTWNAFNNHWDTKEDHDKFRNEE